MVDKEMLAAIEELLDRKLDEKLDQKLDQKLNEKLDQKFDEKLKPINDKLDKLDKRVSNLETGMTKLDKRVSNLETGMKELAGRTGKLETDVSYIKVVQLENKIIPRLNTIEKYYVDTSERYLEKTDQIDKMDSDISILKQVVTNHSEILKKAQ